MDPCHIALLKADSLMYFHVYADLVMLSKSNELGKSILDMNLHYFELYNYLQEVQLRIHSCIMLQQNYGVFQSEEKLYGPNKSVNHRKNPKLTVMYDKLFAEKYESDNFIHC